MIEARRRMDSELPSEFVIIGSDSDEEASHLKRTCQFSR